MSADKEFDRIAAKAHRGEALTGEEVAYIRNLIQAFMVFFTSALQTFSEVLQQASAAMAAYVKAWEEAKEK